MIAAVRSQPRSAARMKTLLESLLSPVGVCLFLAVIIVVASSTAASAQSFILPDPESTVKGLASGWATQAIFWAKRIYLSLLVFELIALAVTTLLFRENLGEFFASVGLKVFVGGIYFWFIMNAGVGGGWASQIIGSFQTAGATFGTRDATWVTDNGLLAAGAYFAAGPVAQAAVQPAIQGAAASASAALLTPCTYVVSAPYGGGTMVETCPGPAAAQPFLALITTLQNKTYPFMLVTEGLGLMIVMALAAIWLQIIIMTIESYIVMGAGVLFIGFAGSRFTMPFSQGYFSYMFNVGVKFMVLYIVLGIEQSLMPAILEHAVVTLGAGAAAASIPGAEYAVLAVAAVGAVDVVIAAALVWMLPGLAGSFLSGQSSASGSAVLGQAMGTMASASSMMANLHQSQRAQAGARREDTAATAQEMNKSASAPRDNSSTSPAHGSAGFGDSNSSELAKAQAQGLPGAPRKEANEPLNDQAKDSRALAETYRANMLSGLAQAAPRDIGQPTAVQVRLSNPDKL